MLQKRQGPRYAALALIVVPAVAAHMPGGRQLPFLHVQFGPGLMVVQEDVSPPPPAMAGGNQLPFEQVQFAAGCGVVHELAGGAGTLPGGCQLPLTHTQVAPGLMVVHVEVLPPPEVPPAAGATQLPLTQVQPVPGLGVVHELATGTLPGGCQLPLMHTQVAPGLIVVHVVEPPVDPPPVNPPPVLGALNWWPTTCAITFE